MNACHIHIHILGSVNMKLVHVRNRTSTGGPYGQAVPLIRKTYGLCMAAGWLKSMTHKVTEVPFCLNLGFVRQRNSFVSVV